MPDAIRADELTEAELRAMLRRVLASIRDGAPLSASLEARVEAAIRARGRFNPDDSGRR